MRLRDLISCVRGDIRITKPVTAGSGETLSPAARRMRDNHVGTLIIVEGQKPVGIVTDRDLALALGADGFNVFPNWARPHDPVEGGHEGGCI